MNEWFFEFFRFGFDLVHHGCSWWMGSLYWSKRKSFFLIQNLTVAPFFAKKRLQPVFWDYEQRRWTRMKIWLFMDLVWNFMAVHLILTTSKKSPEVWAEVIRIFFFCHLNWHISDMSFALKLADSIDATFPHGYRGGDLMGRLDNWIPRILRKLSFYFYQFSIPYAL